MLKKPKPGVTILIPTFNNEDTIWDCLNSIKLQTYRNIKILVIDNGSNDRTLEIARSFKNIKIKIYKNFKGMENLAFCYKNKMVYTKYTAVYHSDDIYHKRIVEEQVQYLEKNPKTILVTTKAYLVNKQNKIISKTNKGLTKTLFKKDIELFKVCLKHYNPLNCPTALFNSKKITFAKKWNIKKFNVSADLSFYFSILKLGYIKILDKYLCRIRISEKQLTQRQREIQKSSDFINLMNSFMKKKGIRKDLNDQDKKLFLILKFRDQIRIIIHLIKNKKNASKQIRSLKILNCIKIFYPSKRYVYSLLYLLLFKIMNFRLIS